MITAVNKRHEVTRNVSFFKKVLERPAHLQEEEEEHHPVPEPVEPPTAAATPGVIINNNPPPPEAAPLRRSQREININPYLRDNYEL
jgi:hypothetical protein